MICENCKRGMRVIDRELEKDRIVVIYYCDYCAIGTTRFERVLE